MRGFFVTFEGVDGAGKTTIARRVASELARNGHRVVLTTEPTRTWLGGAVKRSYREPVGPLAETFLFLADRAAHTERIREWVRTGRIVVSDRYMDSTYAYQGARLRGVMRDPVRWLQRISGPVVLEPDLTILLRMGAAKALRRKEARRRNARFERPAFLARVAANYDRLARGRRWVRIDASRPVDEVAADALRAVTRRLRARAR